ncbi:MAG: hypothetical protein ACI9DJ_003382 [Algoriphagus sp.]|jgi:hypothetical protein
MKRILLSFFFLSTSVALLSCEEKATTVIPDPIPELVTKYFVAIEAATDPATDILSTASSIMEGSVSPINNGIEQPAWMSFFQNENQIIAGGYTSSPEFISYSLENGSLVKGESFFTDLSTYASEFVDNNTLLLMGSAREGLVAKKIYKVNTETMTIEQTVEVDFGNVVEDSLLAFPVDMKVRGGKLFAAYYLISARGNFSTPNANEAKVAVFSYPGLEFEKIISDNRAPNIGRYYSTNALEIAENGDIYTFSPSALSCGYAPVPETNSGILRIRNGETDFDPSFHIDFEAISGGYKIQDLFYVADGKAVVRVVQEDETNGDFLWATYAPASETPLLKTGIVDLNAGTFNMLDNVPLAGGGWNAAYLKEGEKLYLGVSSSTSADIWEINVTTGIAQKGAAVEGNYAKGIFSLTK